VHIEKGYEGKRPRTWVNLTPAGEKALRDEIAHLKRLIQQVEQTTPVTPTRAEPSGVLRHHMGGAEET
jgi:hypothetical protein